MNTILILAFLIVGESYGRSIVFKAGSISPGKLEEKFQEKCLGAEIAIECQAMSAVLRSESETLLSWLENSSHPDTVKVFQDAAQSNDPRLKAYALGYLSRNLSRSDEGLLEMAVQSMLTSDNWLGQVASRILMSSSSKPHQELGEAFSSGTLISDDGSSKNRTDVFFDEFVQSFTTFFENAHFANEQRFIAMDSPLAIPENLEYRSHALGGKAYIVSGSLASVSKDIVSMTGLKEALSPSEIASRLEEVGKEFQVIIEQIQRGDYSQMQRMIILQTEMAELSKQQSFWYSSLPSYSQMSGVRAFFKMKSGSKDELEGAIVLKEWPFYNGTSVVYLGKLD